MGYLDHRRYSSGGLGQLLAALHDRQGRWSLQELGSVWRHQLRSRVDLSPPAGQPGRPSCALSPTYREVLLTRVTPLDQLELIKNFAKAHGSHPDGPLPKDIATMLYYSAIAAALVHHRARITNLDDGKLGHGFCWCLTRDWLDAETRALLDAAWLLLQSQRGAK